MTQANAQVQGSRVLRVAITIPSSASPAANLEELVVAQLEARQAGLGKAERPHIVGGKVSKQATAYTAGDSTSSQPITVATTDVYSEPSVDFLKATYVKSSGAAITNVGVSVYLAGDGQYMNLGP